MVAPNEQSPVDSQAPWSTLPLADWQDTRDTLHMWMQVIRPAAAYYSRELSDFILPYEMVRSASSPDDMVLDFFQSAYSAGGPISPAGIAALDRPPAEWM
jgi:hypothetical protein